MLTIKTPERRSGGFTVNFKHNYITFFSIVDFAQVNVSWDLNSNFLIAISHKFQLAYS